MPSLTGIHHLSLSVTDLERSVSWYTGLLGFTVLAEIEGATFRRTRLGHPEAPFVLTLTRHDERARERFDETGVGLDHLAFQVPSVAEVEAWKAVFEEQRVEHSEISRSPGAARLTFRDPDNVQLEVMAVEQPAA